MKEDFVGAIHTKNKVRVTFYSKEDGVALSRVCAPMDFGPSRRAHSQDDRFHSWDYESDQKNHVLSLPQEQVRSIEVLPDTFDPSEFVTWRPNWIIQREWGSYS